MSRRGAIDRGGFEFQGIQVPSFKTFKVSRLMVFIANRFQSLLRWKTISRTMPILSSYSASTVNRQSLEIDQSLVESFRWFSDNDTRRKNNQVAPGNIFAFQVAMSLPALIASMIHGVIWSRDLPQLLHPIIHPSNHGSIQASINSFIRSLVLKMRDDDLIASLHQCRFIFIDSSRS